MKFLRLLGCFLPISCVFVAHTNAQPVQKEVKKSEEIISTGDIKDVEKATSKLKPGDLAIFDCDDVLEFTPYFTTKEEIPIVPLFNRIKNSKNIGTSEKAVEEMSMLLQNAPYNLVSSKMPAVVKKLQKRGIKTLVLTQVGAGAYGAMKSLAKWRISNLKKLGYNFKKSWNNLKNKVFDSSGPKIDFYRVVKTEPDTPQYVDGMLFAGGFKKDDTLKKFLKYSNQKPANIFFIDDSKKNVESVQKTVLELGIKYVGVHYTAIESSNLDKKCIESVAKAKLNIEKKYPTKQEAL